MGIIFRTFGEVSIMLTLGIPVVFLFLVIVGSMNFGVVVIESFFVDVIDILVVSGIMVLSRLFVDFATLNQFGKKLLSQNCVSTLTAHNKPIKMYTRIFDSEMIAHKDSKYVLEY